jgi:hypothetical protein
LHFGEQAPNITNQTQNVPMKPPSHRRRKEPYYKVQYRDRLTLAWKDLRKEAFDTFAEARAYTRAHQGNEALRIVEFEAGESKTVHEQH